jgi:hypothetical protein
MLRKQRALTARHIVLRLRMDHRVKPGGDEEKWW